MRDQLTRRTVLRALGLGTVILASGTAVTRAKSVGEPEVLTYFDPDVSPPELPENVAVDRRGYKYVSMPPLGEVWRFTPENELEDEPYATFELSGAFLTGPTGVEVDPQGTLYVNVATDFDASGQSATNGIWRVERGGEPELFAALPQPGGGGPTFPNDLTLLGDSVLVTDSLRGVVWQAWPDGTADVWLDDSLLDGAGGFGANGIARSADGTVYVSNIGTGVIVEIPVEPDGSAGTPSAFVGDPAAGDNELLGADGLAFDTRDNLYVAVNDQDKIARVSPDGNVEILAEDGELDQPSDVTFGTSRGQQKTVFITNLALSNDPNPTFMKLDVGVPGRPIRR